MIELAAIIEDIQERYVIQYTDFVRQQTEYCEECAPEVRFNIPDGSLHANHCVIDFFLNEGPHPGPRELMADPVPKLSAVEEDVNDVLVHMSPFGWDAARFEWRGGSLDTALVDAWFDRWVDPTDSRYDPATTLGSIAHSLSVEKHRASIDFGSSPPEAFWDWVEVLSASGVREVRVLSDRTEP